MHPFTESGVAAARYRTAECLTELRKAIATNDERARWHALGQALGHALQAEAHLSAAMRLEEMAVTTGEEEEDHGDE